MKVYQIRFSPICRCKVGAVKRKRFPAVSLLKWLTQDKMAELFQKARPTIIGHIQNIFAEGELNENEVMRKVGISDNSSQSEGMRIVGNPDNSP